MQSNLSSFKKLYIFIFHAYLCYICAINIDNRYVINDITNAKNNCAKNGWNYILIEGNNDYSIILLFLYEIYDKNCVIT